jgi:hypothetical protein
VKAASVTTQRVCALLLMVGVTTATVVITRPAHAEDAVGKITLLNRKALEAYQHLEFESAVRILNEALEQSERARLTQHPIRARTFMTLGIVTLGGLKQRDQAVKYFRKALQIQPEVRLSPGLANPEIQAAFDEAIAGLGSGNDELPPEKALVHAPVRTGQAGQPIAISAVPDKDLEAGALVLRYRAPTSATFTDVPMAKNTAGAFEATIPAAATDGAQVAYFIEARRPNGSVLVGRGNAAEPMVVELARAAITPAATAVTTPSAPAAPSGRFFVAIMGGTGIGWASGTGEATRARAESSVGWTETGQVLPELGYFVTPQLVIGVQARVQMVRGATEYRPDTPEDGECGEDNVCAPASGAIAAFLKATWFVADPHSAFQPYLSLAAGAGNVRQITHVSGAQTCGVSADQRCVDTVAGGPALVGPGFGFRYVLSDGFGIMAGIGGLIGLPSFTATADVNLGLAFQL